MENTDLELLKRRGRPRFRRIRATGATRPGYVRGTAMVESSLLKLLKGLHEEGMRLVATNLRPLAGGPLARILDAVRDTFTLWIPHVLSVATPTVLRLYSAGLKSGLIEAGMSFGPELADVTTVEFLANQPDGLVPTLQGFMEEEREFVEQTIRRSYEAGQIPDLDALVGQLQKRTPRETWRLKRIVRTEARKTTGLGRLAGWEIDPRRDMYDYHYIATVDARTRKQHTRFMREGPYALDRLQVIWTDEREPYNCRCTMARTLKGKERLLDEGLATADEIKELF